MNENWFLKFDDYLNGRMDREERLLFESELANNNEFSSLYSVYSTVETEMRRDAKNSEQDTALKNSLERLTSKYFTAEEQAPVRMMPARYHRLFRISSAVAASVIIVIVVYFSFFQPKPTSRQLAANYISKQLELSQTMDGSKDSLEQGIRAYNLKDYNKALQFFQGVYKAHPTNSEAKKNTGLAYLQTKRYDEALQEFDDLSKMKNLFSNPGMFLKAATLTQRNRQGDMDQAKSLLQQVVQEKAEGSREAAEWLDNWKD